MKKLTYLMIAVTAVSLSASSVFAGQMKDGMTEDEGSGKGTMKMMHKMHGMMRSSTMVASSDGGVIVLSGNKLYKYDKNLSLTKEAEIKTDMDGGMMGGMGGKKKMCCQGKKMMGQDDAEDDEAAEGEAVQPAQEDAEHKSHH